MSLLHRVLRPASALPTFRRVLSSDLPSTAATAATQSLRTKVTKSSPACSGNAAALQQPAADELSGDDHHQETEPHTESDYFIIEQVLLNNLSPHKLEEVVKDPVRAIELRRAALSLQNPTIAKAAAPVLDGLPVRGSTFDDQKFFSSVQGTNCESVIGFVPVPVGVVGPLLVDGRPVHIPMATTEGALLASANRGARALTLSGGVTTVLHRDLMSRAPVLKLPSLLAATELKAWAESKEGLAEMQRVFSTTSRFGRIQEATATVAGRNVFVRFCCSTGDAMGMNMVTKGINAVVAMLLERFEGATLVSLSGNLCCDKKPSAINWITGRGKSVCAEAVLPAKIVRSVLKSEPAKMVEVNITKNLVGSALAGSIGGNNAHAANLVAAVFLATGQDIAQVVESSTCLTTMELVDDNSADATPGDKALLMSINMPSIEVGTVGGGTSLSPQGACLDILGVRGASSSPNPPGHNAQQLARVVCAAVMSGELSLMAALTSNHLVSAHMALNRK